MLASALLCAVLVESQYYTARATASTFRGWPSQLAVDVSPTRIPVTAPPRIKPSVPPMTTLRQNVVPAVRPLNGVRKEGPPMFAPSEVDRAVEAAKHRRQTVAPIQRTLTVGNAGQAVDRRSLGRSTSVGTRATAALPSGLSSGTGINPWWRYSEQSVPGGGEVMVNVGTGNVLLQDDDMAVAHKGIAMAFRRTYNSQSLHDANGDDGAFAGMYGNGWTNTFDAHLTGTGNTIVVSDIDGAQYPYTLASDGVTWTPPVGQHATLASDGKCGFLWTKKSGTSYYFWQVVPNPATCTLTLAQYGGYSGRLYAIMGRNRNTYIIFNYVWDNGVTTAAGKISAISAGTESGLTALLTYADFNGHRLLQEMTYPDGATTVSYGYDSSGDLLTVSRPSNNAAGSRPVQTFGYQSLGSGRVLYYAASPRYSASCNSACWSDGAGLFFGFTGASVALSSLTSIMHYGVVNPTLADGTSTALQSGYSTSAFAYSTEFYSTGSPSATFRDTDGHMTNWVIDTLGRPTQTQVCTASSSQGENCTGLWLVMNESWDANNDLTASVDPRGNETDYAYDSNGNTTEVAWPAIATSQGTFRPTALYSYDNQTNNNVQAYCDPVATHNPPLQKDWTARPAGYTADNLCPSQLGATRYQYDYSDVEEPFGKLTDMWTPLGYHRAIAYANGSEGGDFGLPTSVTGDLITQQNGTARQPTQTYTYDASGNLQSYSTGSGTWQLSYDALNRELSRQDPDGVTSYACYYPDGSVRYMETAAQHALDGASATCQAATPTYAVAMQYDLDGDLTSETRHFGQTASTGAAGITQKFYDGADRLVEVIEPTNDTPFGGIVFDIFPWLTRYIYDLSQGGSVSLQNGPTYTAYGGLYKTQRYVPGDSITINGTTNAIEPQLAALLMKSTSSSAVAKLLPRAQSAANVRNLLELTPSRRSLAVQSANALPSGQWADANGTAFDALDRKTADYRFAPVGNHFYTYDTGALGLLVSEQNGLGDTKSNEYDADGNVSSISFTLGASSTSTYTAGRTYTFDPDGRVAQVGNPQFGSYVYTYDTDGRMTSVKEPTGGSGIPGAPISNSGVLTDSATIAHAYYADGLPSGISVSGGASFSESLDYRADGLNNDTLYSVTAGHITRAYTAAGRLLARQDPTGAEAYTYDSYGQKASAVVPSGTKNAYQYDAEGNPVQFTGPGAGGVSQTFAIAYTATGEIGVNHDVGGGAANFYFDGAPIPFGNLIPWNGQQYTSDAIVDTRNLLVAGQAIEDSSGNVVNTFSYPFDGAGRLTQVLYWQPPGAGYVNVWSAGVSKYSYYDAEDHLTHQKSVTGGFENAGNDQYFFWGPGGRAIVGTYDTSVYRGYHWDGGDLAFTSLQNGSVNDYKLGSDGDLLTADSNQTGASANHYSGAVYYDRGDAGYAEASHDAGGYSAFCANAGEYYVNPCGLGTPSGQTPAFYTAGFGPDLTAYPRDGVTDGFVVLQGARNYEAATGQWTTPDAYAGDVRDPISQAKYMWNRNNPIAYSDPSGYAPCAKGMAWNGTACVPNDQLKRIGGTATNSMTFLPTLFGSVYVREDGYVGRTQNIFRRSAEHLRQGRSIRELNGTRDQSKYDDICLEGFLIRCMGLKSKGGSLPNKREEIGRRNPNEEEMLRHGEEIHERLGSPRIRVPEDPDAVELPIRFFPEFL
ncbi:MAG TPA: DUF6531 domain-containing protein [Candidatus Baltobacteraceae bacterium]|nr:DUF6531 domain-containing protein [Candidatus Baltobacteraceae bacterium]